MNNRRILKIINLLVILFLCTIHLQAQQNEKPFIKLSPALKEINSVTIKQQFIVGSTCKSCALTINEDTVKVYKTGGFAYECNLLENENIFVIESSLKDKKIQQKVIFDLNIPLPPKAVSSFGIESINLVIHTSSPIPNVQNISTLGLLWSTYSKGCNPAFILNFSLSMIRNKFIAIHIYV